MGAKCCYTVDTMRETLRCLTPLFDVVRLVDPTDTAVVTLEEDGSLRRKPYTCFHVWNRECRCFNCTSMQAAAGSCQRTKYEFIRENVFYVVSQPLTLFADGEQLEVVMEIVSHVSDQLLLEEEDGKTIAQRLEELQEKLYRDDLTRAFNRRYLNEFTFLHRGMDMLPRKLGMVLLDLSRFKVVNDTLGHLAGDRMLEDVTQALTSHVRAQDSVIRLGGDEFLVTLPGCDEKVLARKVEELREAVSQVTEADFGYTYTDHFDTTPEFLENMLDEADRHMYEEKRKRKK